ncbi:DUF2931 family protein [Kluyvera chengduensis]|uniref:DUF2931 family protein n=1 Tax=Kluyvera sp. 142359 TaxID=3375726 RepID=UPI003775BE14
MNRKTGTALLFSLILGISLTTSGKELTSLIAPYDEWYFNFFYPYALPAKVTYVELLDTGAYFYQYRAPDGTISSSETKGTWRNDLFAGRSPFNKAKNPPQFIRFCWDSIIDKKLYETRITFSGEVWKMMLTPYTLTRYPDEIMYHRFMLIGLAPEGKVRVWLEDYNEANILITGEKVILIETVSGDQLDLCKGKTIYKDDYQYSRRTLDFIKDKKYPYGEW